MAIQFITVKIRKNELSTLEESFAEWEVPLVEALFEQCERVGKFTVDREAPSAQEEFQRLESRYSRPAGLDGTPGMPLVISIYGAHQPGLMNLQRAIQAAVVKSTGFDDLVGTV